MKTSELRAMTLEELHDQAREARVEVFNLRFRKAAMQLDDLVQIRHAKKNLARVLTLIREKELGLITDEEGS